MVEQAAGQALDEDGVALARAIYEETEGNPFFVREVLRHLAETDAIERDDDRWRTRVPIGELGIPEGVRDVIGRRLSRLTERANEALRVGAVAGTEFDADVVQAAGRFDERELLTALAEALQSRLLGEPSPTHFRFSHALVRATLYESMSGAQKVVLHRRVAEAIETLHAIRLDDDLPALAYHWARTGASAGDTAQAVNYAARAGNRALAQLAHDEAVAYYRQALRMLDTAGGPAVNEEQRCELLVSLGEAQRRAGEAAYRETLLAAARLAVEAGRRAAHTGHPGQPPRIAQRNG